MACFLVPAGEAVAATIAEKVQENKEKEGNEAKSENKIPLSKKFKWLTNLLWGGAILLAYEHLWHGEIAPFFPFLTAMSNPADTSEMLHEMGTVGVAMAVLITVVWFGICFTADAIVERKNADKFIA